MWTLCRAAQGSGRASGWGQGSPVGLLVASTEVQVPFPWATEKKPTEVSSPSMVIGTGHRAGSQKADQGTCDLTGGNALWAGLLLAARLPEATSCHPALCSSLPGDPGKGECVLSETGSESVPEATQKVKRTQI